MTSASSPSVFSVISNHENAESYQLLDLLGKGGFASVYRAKVLNSYPEVFVAIKIIDKGLIKRRNMESRVSEEVAIHSQLSHPSILKMYSCFDDANFWYLVLELAHHGELQKYLKSQHKGRLDEDEAANILGQVVEGLLYLHQNNIMHRDLSLSNLLVVECQCTKTTSHLHVKIADFGLATMSRPNEKHMTLCGTPNYISPEVVSRVSHGLPADVWGLGCLLYTLLAGQPPFDTNGVTETLTRVMAVDYRMPEFLSYEAKDLIRRLLQKNPVDRIRLQDVNSHPFMQKEKGFPKFSSTLASMDSGVLTMSSNASQNVSRPSPYSGSPYNSTPKHASDFSPYNRRQELSSLRSDIMQNHHVHRSIQAVKSFEIQKENNFAYREAPRAASAQGRATPMPTTPLVTSTPQAEKLDVPPLNTTRLLPTRHTTKDVILTIHEDGQVELEYTRRRLRFRISGDGMSVVVTEGSRESHFGYHSLPPKHVRRYKNACKFVEVVKAKTPKVTYYSPRAKVQLMETLEDFEAFFYSGIRITKTVLTGIKAFDRNDTEMPAPADEWEHFEECQRHCLLLEETLSQIPTPSFPITVGRRPNLPVPAAPLAPLEAFSTPTSSRVNSRLAPSSSSTVVVREATVPGIGTIVQYSSKNVELTFTDASKIAIVFGAEYFTYSTFGGSESRYSVNDVLPVAVREKFQQFNVAMKQLAMAPESQGSSHLRFMR